VSLATSGAHFEAKTSKLSAKLSADALRETPIKEKPKNLRVLFRDAVLLFSSMPFSN